MNYEKNYYDYIKYVKTLNRYKGDGKYYEKHHIIPKSLGGTNDEENLVLLTAREHFLAHYLLCKFITEKEQHYKMVCAFNLLLSFEKKSTVQLEERTKAYNSSRFYSFLKEKYSKEVSSLRKGRKIINRKKAEKRYWIFNENYSKDRMVLLEEIPVYLQQGWKRGRLNKNKPCIPRKKGYIRVYNSETNLEKSITIDELETYLLNGWKKGRRPVSEETKRKHKQLMLDPNGKNQEYFKKLRNGEVFRNKNTGKKCVNKNGQYKLIKIEEVEDYLLNGWKLGGAPKSNEWKQKMSKKMIGNQNGRTKGGKNEKSE